MLTGHDPIVLIDGRFGKQVLSVSLVLGVGMAEATTVVELRDADDGRVVNVGRARHAPTRAETIEADPRVWWQGLVEACQQAGRAAGVGAVAVAAHQSGVVVLDEHHEVLRPSHPATVDARADAAGLIEALGGPSEWVAEVGMVPDATFPVVQLAWLRRTEPRRFAATAKILTLHAWLTYRLSRQFVTDRGDASRTGFWSPRENRWRADLLTLVDDTKDWGACLPRVAAASEPAGDRGGVRIAPGTGAAMSAALGVALRPGDLLVLLDASTMVCTVRDRPTEDPRGVVAGYADATGRFLPTVSLQNGVNVLGTIARLIGADRNRFDQLALSAPPGARGVSILPYFAGERIPPRPPASGLVVGLGDAVTAAHVARAAVEGVACSVLDAVDALHTAEVPAGGRIVLTGDGARSHAVAQILADLSGRAVSVPSGDAVATGACVQAAAALHRRPAEEVADAWGVAPDRAVEPATGGNPDAVRAQFRAAQARN